MRRTPKTQTDRGQAKRRSTACRLALSARSPLRRLQAAVLTRLTPFVAENAPRDTIRSRHNDADSAARKLRRRNHLRLLSPKSSFATKRDATKAKRPQRRDGQDHSTKQTNRTKPTRVARGLAGLHPVDRINPVILSKIRPGMPAANHSAGKIPSPNPFDRSR